MPILGAHMSIAGGYYKAVDAAAECKMDCVQLFTKNNNQWRAKPISDEEVARFAEALDKHHIAHPIAHDSYLINLGSPDDELWSKSIDALVVELQRAEMLGIPYVVAHPGAFTTSSEAAGLKRIAKGIDEVHQQTRQIESRVLLETTAGQGSNLGWKFEHLRDIIDQAKQPDRLGVCVDTCHIFAAGYPLESESDYEETVNQLEQIVGLERVAAFHLNDSKKPLGSRVDRHEHIGQGCLGRKPFKHLMNDPRFREVPMYLETPKGERDDGTPWDVVNIRKLRRMVRPV